MATPYNRNQEMTDAIKRIFGFDPVEFIEKDQCVPPPMGCSGPAREFKNAISRREYEFSGLCQACQDKTFGPDEEDPVNG